MRDGAKLVRDDEGSELRDLNAARAEALLAAGEILADRIKAGRTIGHRSFEIVDNAGVVLITVPFRMALKLD